MKRTTIARIVVEATVAVVIIGAGVAVADVGDEPIPSAEVCVASYPRPAECGPPPTSEEVPTVTIEPWLMNPPTETVPEEMTRNNGDGNYYPPKEEECQP